MDRLGLRSESGFTLIELLVVVAIIGILAAIAIPQFSAYRSRGWEAQVRSDLRNAATAQEALFAAGGAYAALAPMTNAGAPGFNPTPGVTVNSAVPAVNRFTLAASHAQCGAAAWTFDSATGVIAGGPCP